MSNSELAGLHRRLTLNRRHQDRDRISTAVAPARPKCTAIPGLHSHGGIRLLRAVLRAVQPLSDTPRLWARVHRSGQRGRLPHQCCLQPPRRRSRQPVGKSTHDDRWLHGGRGGPLPDTSHPAHARLTPTGLVAGYYVPGLAWGSTPHRQWHAIPDGCCDPGRSATLPSR